MIRPVGRDLWLMPSSLDLAAAELRTGRRHGRSSRWPDSSATSCAPTRRRSTICVIDCPPSLGILTLNALAAVEEVFIPLQPHFLALHGLSKLLETIDLVADGSTGG